MMTAALSGVDCAMTDGCTAFTSNGFDPIYEMAALAQTPR
jgi:hypothetical protein